MGASYALGLGNKYEIHGYDISEEVVSKALNRKLIKSAKLVELSTSDLVILALYPENNIKFIKENIKLFNNNQVITDLSGVKKEMIDDILKLLPKDFTYTSHHPMAGRATPGIDYANIEMFSGSNFIITPTELTRELSIKLLTEVANHLGFSHIIQVGALEHDELIAYTSQLTHLIAVSLMLANQNEKIILTTGDSFRDLTRIANINEELWTELFFSNKEALIGQIDLFTSQLKEFSDLLKLNEITHLKEKLITSRKKRYDFDNPKNK